MRSCIIPGEWVHMLKKKERQDNTILKVADCIKFLTDKLDVEETAKDISVGILNAGAHMW